MITYLVRIWLPDRPGALGQVASRIGAVRGDVVGIEILERDGRDALIEYLMREGGRSIYYVIPTDSPIRAECVRMFGSHPVELYRTGMLEFARSVPDLVPAFKALELPVLGLCGALDPFPDDPSVLAGMRNFRELAPIPGACRFVHWEHPAVFNRILEEFLASCPA